MAFLSFGVTIGKLLLPSTPVVGFMSQSFQIQTSALFGIDQLINQLGGEADAWLAAQGCSLSFINTPNKVMDIQQFVSVLQNGAAQFKCPDFGLRLGSTQDFRILGSLGLLMQNCHTPREALAAARSFMVCHNQSEYWEYTEQGENVYLKRYEIFHELSDSRQYKELSFSACYQLCRLIMGDNFHGVRIEFSHAAMSNQSRYEKYFKMPVLFNCEQDQMVIPKHYLDTPIANTDKNIHAFAKHYLIQFNQQHNHDIVQQVSHLIQQTMSNQNQSIDNIAKLLGMSRRTLQRRLSDHGIIFKKLLNEIRLKTACWYLISSNIDITLLSEMLGYSEVSNFSRTFKHALGIPPLKWRKQSRKQPLIIRDSIRFTR